SLEASLLASSIDSRSLSRASAAPTNRKDLFRALNVVHSIAVPLQAILSSTSGNRNAIRRNACICACSSQHWSPIDDRTVILVVALGVLPLVADLVGHGVLVEIDSKPRPAGNIDEAVLHDERLLQIAFPERSVLQAEEVRNRRRELNSRSQRDRPERVV